MSALKLAGSVALAAMLAILLGAAVAAICLAWLGLLTGAAS